jgi:hypothetical protein
MEGGGPTCGPNAALSSPCSADRRRATVNRSPGAAGRHPHLPLYRCTAGPYFMARDLALKADIIFCPYRRVGGSTCMWGEEQPRRIGKKEGKRHSRPESSYSYSPTPFTAATCGAPWGGLHDAPHL